MNRTLARIVTAGLSLALASVAVGAPIVIDPFTAGQTGPPNGTVDDGSILGGERDVITNGSTSLTVAGGSAVLTAADPNFVLLDYDGNDDDFGAPSHLLGSIDLTGGGMNDRFVLDVTAISGTVDLTVRISDSLTDYSEGVTSISSTGLLEFAFADLSTVVGGGGVASSVERIVFRFNFNSDESITLNEIRTDAGAAAPVPEPSTMLLLGLGLCGLGLSRRKRASA